MTAMPFIFGIIGTAIIFAVAAWTGPKVIRAIYPEVKHDPMIKAQRMMVIIALIVAVIGLISGSFAYFATPPG